MGNKFEENKVIEFKYDTILRISPELAQEIGVNESILLLQLEYFVTISDNYKDGRMWTYQSLSALKEKLPFWSKSTLNRTLKNLIKMDLIYDGCYNKHKYDKTKWYSLNYEKINNLHSIGISEAAIAKANNLYLLYQKKTKK